MKITIQGDPRPMGRPRVVGGHVYYHARDIEWRETIRWTLLSLFQNRKQYEGPLEVRVKFYRKLNPSSKQYGDIDNLLKGLFDGMNGIIFKDDSQIVKVVAEKYCDKENPRVEAEIVPLRGAS